MADKCCVGDMVTEGRAGTWRKVSPDEALGLLATGFPVGQVVAPPNAQQRAWAKVFLHGVVLWNGKKVVIQPEAYAGCIVEAEP